MRVDISPELSQIIALESLLDSIPQNAPWLEDLDYDIRDLRTTTGRLWTEDRP